MYESLVPSKEVISAVTNRWLNNSIQEFMQSSTLLQTNKNELTSLSNNGPIPGFTYPLIPSLGDKLEATYDKSECIVISDPSLVISDDNETDVVWVNHIFE